MASLPGIRIVLTEIVVAMFDGAIAALFLFTAFIIGVGVFDPLEIKIEEIRSYSAVSFGIPKNANWDQIADYAEFSTRKRAASEVGLNARADWNEITRAQQEQWTGLICLDQG